MWKLKPRSHRIRTTTKTVQSIDTSFPHRRRSERSRSSTPATRSLRPPLRGNRLTFRIPDGIQERIRQGYHGNLTTQNPACRYVVAIDGPSQIEVTTKSGALQRESYDGAFGLRAGQDLSRRESILTLSCVSLFSTVPACCQTLGRGVQRIFYLAQCIFQLMAVYSIGLSNLDQWINWAA